MKAKDPPKPKAPKDDREAWTVRPTVPRLPASVDSTLAAAVKQQAVAYREVFDAIRACPKQERNAYMLRLLWKGFVADGGSAAVPAVAPAPPAPPPAPTAPADSKETKRRKKAPAADPPPAATPERDHAAGPDDALAELG